MGERRKKKEEKQGLEAAGLLGYRRLKKNTEKGCCAPTLLFLKGHKKDAAGGFCHGPSIGMLLLGASTGLLPGSAGVCSSCSCEALTIPTSQLVAGINGQFGEHESEVIQTVLFRNLIKVDHRVKTWILTQIITSFLGIMYAQPAILFVAKKTNKTQIS